jgi:two-component system response regulator PilR (NtrC family)
VLSATHKDLAKLVEAGDFRQDLYYRINVIELKVPSLRQRREDIPQLAEHILNQLCANQDIEPPQIGIEAIEALQRYAFPGNVRELENILERALTLCNGEHILTDDLALPQLDPAEQQEANLDQPPPPPAGVALEDYLEQIERQAILKALDQTRNNKTAAAKLLGITFRAMRYRLKKLGLE